MREAEEELQRLRRDLYRSDPPPGALERYERLRAQHGAERSSPAAGTAVAELPVRAPSAAPDDEPPARPERAPQRQRVVAAGASVLVAAAVVTTVLVAQGGGHGGAAALAPALAAGDGPRLEQVLGFSGPPWGPSGAGRTVVDVLRRADLPQLRVWDRREAFGWLQRGSGPVHRDIRSDGSARVGTEPLSIVLRCRTDAAYRWTLRGTEPGSDAVRVLASGAADRCDRATVATATLPARARLTAFDLQVPDGVGWTMAVVVAERG